jgi:hypothetical protein
LDAPQSQRVAGDRKVRASAIEERPKKKLKQAVGRTSALEIAGPTDLPQILKAVEAASRTARA